MESPYISGPMTGYTRHNFPAFFRAEEKLIALGYSPLNPARNTGQTCEEAYEYAVANPQTWEWYIRKDTQAVLAADGIVLLPGWHRSKGACLEVVVSIAVGNALWLYMEDPYDQEVVSLLPIDRDGTYRKALKYLLDCGLGGVELTPAGHAKYV